jgi:hypothetical protein
VIDKEWIFKGIEESVSNDDSNTTPGIYCRQYGNLGI